jgi:hypothetical protein
VRRASVAVLALTAVGCSLIGLTDGLEQESCRDCAELNAIDPTGDPCLSWQCSNPNDPMAGMCVVGTLDGDEDGAPSAMCVSDATADCDDANAENTPMRAESCDLADNDCDGSVDEDALAIDRADLVEGALSALSWAHGEMEVVAAYGSGSDLFAAHLPTTGAPGTAVRLAGPATNPDPGFTAIARTGGDWAIAYTPSSGCSRIVLGTWSGTGTALAMPVDHHVNGLPKVGGDCASGDTSGVGHPSMASIADRQVVVAYLADREDRSCGGAAADVGLVVVQRSTTGESFADALASAAVGQSVDGAPALIAIPGYGYLLAFARADGTIGVHRVEVDGATLEATVSEDVYVETCAVECGDVSLTAAQAGSGYEIALAFRDGDCTNGAAALRVLSLDPTSGAIASSGALRSSASGTAVRRPTAARRSGPDEWILAWTESTGAERTITAQRWSADGEPTGDAAVLLTTTGTFPEPSTGTAGTGGEGYRVFSYDSGAATLSRASASCGAGT